MKDNHALHFITINDNSTTAHRRIRFVVAIPGKFNARLAFSYRWPVVDLPLSISEHIVHPPVQLANCASRVNKL
jgi:hypothetical protein